MADPFRPSASGPDYDDGVGCASGCASGCDSWAPHHIRLNGDGDICRLCSSCVLLCNPDAFCSACLLLVISPDASAAVSREPRANSFFSAPGPTAACSRCSVFVAHLSCISNPYAFVCPACAARADGRPFSFDQAGGRRRKLDERGARVLLAAAQLAHESACRAAAAAREKAERIVQEAAVARKRSRAMLDAAFSALEAEARDARKQVTPPATELLMKKTPKSSDLKKKTPKSSEANRERDKLLKFSSMQQPALAFAAAAAAAASPVPLPMPSSRPDKRNPMKQDGRGSATEQRKMITGRSSAP